MPASGDETLGPGTGESALGDGGGLAAVGYTDACALALAALEEPGLVAGRVFDERRGVYAVFTAAGSLPARVAGRFRHRVSASADLPVIGDWVAVRTVPDPQGMSTIHAVLPRRTKLARKVAGERTDEQVLAANVDTAVILMGLDGDLNLRRLDRFVAMVRAGDVAAMVLLTKADLLGLGPEDLRGFPEGGGGSPEARELLRVVMGAIPGVPVVPVTLLSGELPPALEQVLLPARTLALLGSSGVGKSTLLNRLIGRSAQSTMAVRRSDGRGRHTTTHRQMFRIPGGALVIDTPGLREIQLHGDRELPDDAFPDVAALAPLCRFRDCQHDRQPGCAVEAAVEAGRLAPNRLDSYLRLQRSRAIKPRFPRPPPGGGRPGPR
jgi:ribosome biogenesis GTPase / thiamine phosphate phosphatase